MPQVAAGSQCADCHADIVAQYARSGMSHTWRPVTPALAAAAAPPATVNDRLGGYRYEVRARNGQIWQAEIYANDSGHRIERRADYQVGSGHHAIAWVSAENGFLTELPVGWFADSAWRMNPGYELKNHRFSRPITAGCVACHSTTAVHEQPTTNRFSVPIVLGIDCIRCHGNAEEHIAFWKSPSADEPPPAARLAHPGHFAPERANDLCLQCHLQGDVSVHIGQISPFDFRPGQRLRDQRHDFFIAGQPETLGIASHGARMLQGRCYVASGEKLTCIHCHDPHRPVSDFSADHFDSKCQTCHQPAACTRPPAEPLEQTVTSCIACHMPKRPTREGIHLVFTDHALRRRAAPLDHAQPPLLSPNANVELTSAWPGAEPDAGTLGAAYVLLHETMGPQTPSLHRGRELLAEAVATNPADLDSRYWLGSALLALARPAEAKGELQFVLKQQPARHDARYRLALAEEALGNPAGAIALYQQILAAAPHWPEPHARLAQLLLSRQQPAESARVVQKLVALEPTATNQAALALAERLGGASHEQALAIVAKAIERDPREPSAYVTRGTLHLLDRQPDAARADFESALAIDPANAAAQQALRALSRSQ